MATATHSQRAQVTAVSGGGDVQVTVPVAADLTLSAARHGAGVALLTGEHQPGGLGA